MHYNNTLADIQRYTLLYKYYISTDIQGHTILCKNYTSTDFQGCT